MALIGLRPRFGLAHDAVWIEPVSSANSLLTGKITGKFFEFKPDALNQSSTTHCFRALPPNSLIIGTGNFSDETAIYFQGTGSRFLAVEISPTCLRYQSMPARRQAEMRTSERLKISPGAGARDASPRVSATLFSQTGNCGNQEEAQSPTQDCLHVEIVAGPAFQVDIRMLFAQFNDWQQLVEAVRKIQRYFVTGSAGMSANLLLVLKLK